MRFVEPYIDDCVTVSFLAYFILANYLIFIGGISDGQAVSIDRYFCEVGRR